MDIALALGLAAVWGLLAFLIWDVMSPLFRQDIGVEKAHRILEHRRRMMQ